MQRESRAVEILLEIAARLVTSDSKRYLEKDRP
jgi:hypothetical protein